MAWGGWHKSLKIYKAIISASIAPDLTELTLDNRVYDLVIVYKLGFHFGSRLPLLIL